MGLLKKLKYPLMAAAAAAAAPYALPALGGLLGMGGAAGAAGAGAGAAGGTIGAAGADLFGSMEAGELLGGFGAPDMAAPSLGDLAAQQYGGFGLPDVSVPYSSSWENSYGALPPPGGATYPVGPDGMPGDMLWPDNSDMIEANAQRAAPETTLAQYAQRGMAKARGLLGDDKMGYAALMMAQSGGQRPQPMQSAPPQRQEFGPTALSPQERRKQRLALGGYLYG